MPSRLYERAVASLTEEVKTALQEFERWAESFAKVDSAGGAQGEGVVANLREECHLVGDGAFGEPEEMAVFLGRCVEEHGRSMSDEERHAGYAQACADHEGRGLSIPRKHLPDGLLRYSRNFDTAKRLVERFLGPLARRRLEDGSYSIEEAFADLALRWDSSQAPGSLGAGAFVFATFDSPAGAPRHDAPALAKVLALPIHRADRILIEFSYPTDAVGDYRFPTVADVGWVHEFQPAPELVPDPQSPATCHGWTRSIDGSAAQPELVHTNESLRVLDRAPRFVGRLSS